MTDSILSDALLRQLIAAGQADIVVGVPTFNNAATVGATVRAALVSVARQFPRERAVLLNSDGGSSDGTPDVVRAALGGDVEGLLTSHVLRTIHGISAPYHGLPGKRSGLRTIFTAGELLQARAIVILDPDVTSITPEWVTRLVQPVLREGFDYVAPVYARQPFEGMLVTQIQRPCVRAAWARRLREPMGAEFACSTRFAGACAGKPIWDSELARVGIDLWIAGTALSGDYRIAQAALGPRVLSSSQGPPLPELLRQVVGSLFACLEDYADVWRAREGSEPVPLFGDVPPPVDGGDGDADPRPMAEAFRAGMRDLAPVLDQILSGEVLAELRSAATASEVHMPDPVWAATVYEFAAAHHREVMNRQHLVQALVPLYLGRVASFVAEPRAKGAPDFESRHEDVALAYERSKPHLVERWNAERGR